MTTDGRKDNTAPWKRRRITRCASRLRAVALVCALSLIAFSLAMFWGGCNVEKHYALLSFFFDGVPDPELLEASKDELWRVKQAGGTVYAHRPYTEEKCNECHRGSSGVMLTRVDASACLNCHSDVLDGHRHMHGPVAAAACLYCHAPHESTIKSLLRAQPSKLCMQCHGTTFGRGHGIPEHSDPARNCLDCHGGHGGDHRYFLHGLTPQTPAGPPPG